MTRALAAGHLRQAVSQLLTLCVWGKPTCAFEEAFCTCHPQHHFLSLFLTEDKVEFPCQHPFPPTQPRFMPISLRRKTTLPPTTTQRQKEGSCISKRSLASTTSIVFVALCTVADVMYFLVFRSDPGLVDPRQYPLDGVLIREMNALMHFCVCVLLCACVCSSVLLSLCVCQGFP